MHLHILNISPGISDEEIKTHLSRFGQVLDLTLKHNSIAGRVSASAVAAMCTNEAKQAYEAMKGKSFRGRKIYVVLV